MQKRVGSGKAEGGHSGTELERILKQANKYILRVTNNTTSNNDVSITVSWYEHANIA